MMGVHHAREWPSGEHAMEWAYELIKGYKSDDPRIKQMVTDRTIIVPIVNPDGFNASREAGEPAGPAPAAAATRPRTSPARRTSTGARTAALLDDARPATACSLGRSARARRRPEPNYGGFWGGPAPAPIPCSGYRGPGPFSEPESQNIRG